MEKTIKLVTATPDVLKIEFDIKELKDEKISVELNRPNSKQIAICSLGIDNLFAVIDECFIKFNNMPVFELNDKKLVIEKPSDLLTVPKHKIFMLMITPIVNEFKKYIEDIGDEVKN